MSRLRVVIAGCLFAALLIVILRLAGYADGEGAAGVAKAWAVGQNGTILFFDGKAWKSVPSGTTAHVRAVSGTGEKDVWAVTDSKVMRWDGKSWKTVETGLESWRLNTVFARTASDVWVGGELGVIMHWDGRTWTKTPMPGGARMDVYRLHGSAANDIWGLAAGGAWVVHWDGEKWNDGRWFTGRARGAIWAFSPKDAWVTFQGAAYRWNGSEWSRENTGGWVHSSSLIAYAPDEMWACGEDKIQRRKDGRWEAMALPELDTTSNRFFSLARAKNGRAFAVGLQGVILEYDGGTWRKSESGTKTHLAAVWAY